MTRHILVATDFSPRSDRALRRATMLAKQSGMALSLLAVVDDGYSRDLADAEWRSAEETMAATAHGLRLIDGLEVRTEIVSGEVTSAILAMADRIDPALIVLGPHRPRLGDAFMGSTAQHAITHGSHPVLLAAGVPASPYDKAILALDIDEPSKAAARRLRSLPILEDASLIALHAFDAPAQGMMRRGLTGTEDVREYVASEQRHAAEGFRALLGELRLASAHPLVVPVNGRPARTILDTARDVRAPLVIMGTGQSRGLKRLILGSVAGEVLDGADRDVLVIPHVRIGHDHALATVH